MGPFNATGMPRYFTTDESERVLRVYPAPSEELAGEVFHLRVARLPLLDLALVEPPEVEPPLEMPARYHLEIVEWAAFRALRNHDVDAENMGKASAHKTRFEQAITEATRSRRRANMAPIGFDFNANWR